MLERALCASFLAIILGVTGSPVVAADTTGTNSRALAALAFPGAGSFPFAAPFLAPGSPTADRWPVSSKRFAGDAGAAPGKPFAPTAPFQAHREKFGATTEAVEYYHAGFNHYVVTADADEIAGLDRHVYPPVLGANWERTGQSFDVLMLSEAGVAPVCRFFGTFGTVSSHFYTADPLECAGLSARYPAWQYEKIAFHMPLPDAAGRCVAGAFPVYRMYNNSQGGAPNHRFTTHLPTVVDFVANRGWVDEGSGPIGVAMCSPQSSIVGTAEGMWAGATLAGSLVLTYVLDDGTYYMMYSIPGTYYVGGMIEGHGTSTGGRFVTTDARDFSVSGLGVRDASFGADYVPESSIDGDLTFSRSSTPSSPSTRYIAAYDDTFEHPANLAAAAGTYLGQAGVASGIGPAILTATSNGAVSGSAFDCTFDGTVTPRDGVDILDFAITFSGGGCPFETSTFVGFARYDAGASEFLAFAVNASRTDSILFVGTRT